jgi:putative GTP pyrophosphokinase
MDGDLIEPIPDRRLLEAEYNARQDAYHGFLAGLERQIRASLERAGLKPTIKGRVKSFDSLYKKKLRLLRKPKEEGEKTLPVSDIVGLRVVCPFLGDLSTAEAALRSEFSVVEVERKGAERSFKEFGYESIHLLARLPERLIAELGEVDFELFEIQLRTILQEAWAEVEHELVYKAELTPFDEPLKRKLAALNANLSLSDIIFQEIRDYQHRLGSELHSRREAFYAKIEEAVDGAMVSEPALGAGGPLDEARLEDLPFSGTTNIDDLLLDALYAHNRKNYSVAIENYRNILANSLAPELASVVHKHRGMAYFSESRYEEAIADFGQALELNKNCYKSAYFRGVVRSVIGEYGAAISDFCLSLRINPYQFFALYRRAQAYWHLGDYPKALADCEEALKIEPGSREAMELRHLAHERLRM